MASRPGDDPALSFSSPGEELANVATHALGAVLGVAGGAVIAWLAHAQGRGLWEIASFGIYAVTLVCVYLASTLYHLCRTPGRKSWLRSVDHAGIFFFFGGSYTPFAMFCLPDSRLWLFLFFAWGIAFSGMAIKLFFFNGSSFCLPSVIVYLVMSALIYVSLGPIFAVLTFAKAGPLMFGGIAAYLIGLCFFAWEDLPYNHAIWHLFVLTGSVCHYFAAMLLLFA
jgi:hemolysin III